MVRLDSGVGEVVIAGTGLYLAGDFLYHHWTPFRNVANDVGHATVKASSSRRREPCGAIRRWPRGQFRVALGDVHHRKPVLHDAGLSHRRGRADRGRAA